MKRWLSLTLIALLAACASKPPSSISRVPENDPGLASVRVDIERNLGTEVRWGGTISKIENRPGHTWIEIVRYDLQKNGKPDSFSPSDGRFIASLSGFFDPLIYKPGRLLTVIGRVSDKIHRTIGEYEYLFPLVEVTGSHLWSTEYRSTPSHYPSYPPPWWYYNMRFYHPHPHHRHRRVK